ncbi:MAG: tRNA preQ1(34) S-adenosylmethionine ribosyltransferase-isomerase QueA, partial [Myxococcota bacterium]
VPGWEFELPDALVARHPAGSRIGSRLMVVPRSGGEVDHARFSELPDRLEPGDLLVGNDSRVMAARVRATRASGGAVELMFLEPGPGPIPALARPARKLRPGEVLQVAGGGTIVVESVGGGGVVRVRTDPEPTELMAACGEIPLPPYLGRSAEPADRERYQTVYARPLGSAAAPTAGLHFDRPTFEALERRGVGFVTVTLHVGLGTFRPVRPEDVERGELHPERFAIPTATADAIRRTRAAGGRVIAVGTTSARALESATALGERIPSAGEGVTRLFVQPPYTFRAIDGLITNFHLPGSSLLMLVGALIGRDRLLAAYAEAVRSGYRFYSYGDVMLLV